MKQFFTLLLCAYTFSAIQAQNAEETVPLVAYWPMGISYDFKITKIKTRWKEEQLIKSDTNSYVANFEVIDSSETGYKIKWSYVTTLQTVEYSDKIMETLSEHTLPEIIYNTSDVGEFEGIENWEEVSKMMTNIFDEVTKSLSADLDEKQQITFLNTMQQMKSLYQSKEVMEQMAFKELHYLHFPFGIEYSTKVALEYEELLPNNFGGTKPIRGDAKIAVEQVDFEQNTCTLRQTMKLNAKDTKEAMKKFFEKLLSNDPEAQKKMANAMKSSRFEINDNNKYEYYYYPGVPILIEAIRETIIDMENEKGKRVDITRIEWIH